MYVADALSRAFRPDGPVPDEMNDDVTKMINSLVENLPMRVEKLEELKSATVEDEVLQQLAQFIKDGWPSSRVNSPSAVGH